MAPGRDAEFAEMLDEFRTSGELDVYRGVFAIAWNGYAVFYESLSKMKLGGYPKPDFVPMDAYFIESDGRILGEVYIRKLLTPQLEQVGGHIGYKVRPSCRNRGVATAALRLALKELDSMNIERALVTCKATNVASARVIEKCGGLRTTDALTPDGIEWRYWIPTHPNSMG
jgi:predicted acetyltransferase